MYTDMMVRPRRAVDNVMNARAVSTAHGGKHGATSFARGRGRCSVVYHGGAWGAGAVPRVGGVGASDLTPLDRPPGPRARRVPGRGRGCRCGEGGRRRRGRCCRGGPPASCRALGRRRCGRDGRVRGRGLHELGGEARVACKARSFHGRRVGDLGERAPNAPCDLRVLPVARWGSCSALRCYPGFRLK